MLPNLSIPSITIYGPVKIHPFGAIVAVALIVGYHLVLKRAAKTGLDMEIMGSAAIWAALIGFAVSHLFWAFFYNYHLVKENPLVLLMVWRGISSYGGFFGGAFGAWLFLRKKDVDMYPYLEAILYGLVPAWAIARLGCTIAFDHPGRVTGFVLGMTDMNGIVRHNLGFYEMLWTVVLAALLYGFRKYNPFRGFPFALVFLLYSSMRFYLDSLRVQDRLYWGFTPGQYFSVIVFGIGLLIIYRGTRDKGLKES
ncbi:MAG: prolipoprotein diacylglyceryl transferase [Pseudomonadota bacterium]|jgi:phosphatidylglycerol:prolipoprotein diacylglycerol transferase